jgi:alpha-L-rhamnosidase
MVKLSCFSFLFLFTCTVTFAGNPKPGPTGLMVEFLRNPSGGAVNDQFPGFSWIVNDTKGESQRSYQVLVSTSRKKIDSGDGDAWNSGKVSSGISVNVKYAGLSLKSNSSYFWNVRTWSGQSAREMISEIQAHFYKDLKNKTLISLAREDGLISTQTGLLNETVLKDIHMKAPIRDIVDWPLVERDGNEMPKVSTVINAFHCESLKLMSLIAGALGYSDDVLFFKNRAEQVKTSVNQKLFDQVSRKYTDGEGSAHSSLHANIFPMAFGLVPGESVNDVAKFISSKGMACSVYGAQFLLEALYQAGEDKVALDLMRATNDRGWWNMIKSGSTITLEAWDAKYKPNLDWNHAWGAVPANMVTRGLWGIVPLTPGFGVAQIKPQTGGLTYSEIKTPTIRGSISCEFKTDNKTQFDLMVSLPSDMKAVVYVPVREISNPVLFVDGKMVKGTKSGKFFVTETGGGKSRFTVRNDEKQSKLY